MTLLDQLPAHLTKSWMRKQPGYVLLDFYTELCATDRQKPRDDPRDPRIVRLRYMLEERGIL